MDRAEESSVMIAPHALQEMSSQAGSTQLKDGISFFELNLQEPSLKQWSLD